MPDKSHDEQQLELDGTDPHVERDFIDILFQFGPVGDHGVNGCQVEDIIDIIVKRLEGFQRGPFHCRENALAITKLQEAWHWLDERTGKRLAQTVEGKNKPHES